MDAGVPYRGVPASGAHMLTATTEVEAPLSVAEDLYSTPRGVFQGRGVGCLMDGASHGSLPFIHVSSLHRYGYIKSSVCMPHCEGSTVFSGAAQRP